jgi:ribonuclease BN (tRNA processing enzyme)
MINVTNENNSEKVMMSIARIAGILNDTFYEGSEEEFWLEMQSLSNRKVKRFVKTDIAGKKQCPACVNWARRYKNDDNGMRIIYIKSNSKEIRIRVLKDGIHRRETTTGNLAPITKELEECGIYRVHVSHAVNIKHVKKVDADFVYMDDMQKIPWSQSFKELNWHHFEGLVIDPENEDFNRDEFIICDL